MSVLRIQQVVTATGLSRMTIYRLEKGGGFPSRLQLSPHAVGWRKEDIDAWINSRPSASAAAAAPSKAERIDSLRVSGIVSRMSR
jgi:prophage regulatory protein